MALKANALVTLAKAKSHLGISTTSLDSRIEQIVNTASQVIESYTSRKLVTQSHTEIIDGRSTNKLLLGQYPITGGPATGNLPQVFIDASSIFDAATEIDTDQYRVEKNNLLVRVNRIWGKGYQNIKVIYNAGIGDLVTDDIPADLEWATLEVVSWYYNTTSNHRIGVLSQGKLGESVSFEQPEYPNTLILWVSS